MARDNTPATPPAQEGAVLFSHRPTFFLGLEGGVPFFVAHHRGSVMAVACGSEDRGGEISHWSAGY